LNCVIACSAHHRKAFSIKNAYIRIECIDELNFAIKLCKHCTKPRCIEVCPVDAFIRTDRTYEIDTNKCTGCMKCAKACPFDAIVSLPKGIAGKCDLCDGTPRCVSACTQNAIKLLEKN
jgi:Fe-S-cluster-containing hydrogenase component 2